MAKIYKKAWLSVYESHAFLLLLFLLYSLFLYYFIAFCLTAFCYMAFFLIVLLFASLFQQLFKI